MAESKDNKPTPDWFTKAVEEHARPARPFNPLDPSTYGSPVLQEDSRGVMDALRREGVVDRWVADQPDPNDEVIAEILRSEDLKATGRLVLSVIGWIVFGAVDVLLFYMFCKLVVAIGGAG